MNWTFWAHPVSTGAARVDALMTFIFLVSIFFCLLIAGLIVFFAIRYHHKTKADRSHPVNSNLMIEIIWMGIPLGLLLVMFVWGAKLFVNLHQSPASAADVYVVGKQWMWKIQHSNGRREINELHIPVGRPIRLLMISEDVIHSFYVPDFHVKQDVLPGRYTSEWFQATQVGKYRMFCAQYCGTSHAQMGGWVYAMEPADFEKWLKTESSGTVAGAAALERLPSPDMVSAGGKIFERLACASCHRSSSSSLGPSLSDLFGKTVPLQGGGAVVADDSYLRESILKPMAKIVKGYGPLMPSYQGQVSEEDLTELIAYIKSLKQGDSDGRK
jgi:cytochrome c oxidase subunit 2